MQCIELKHLQQLLLNQIASGICVAFSGGVDSSLLLKIACDLAKDTKQRILAVTFQTKLHPYRDLKEAEQLAKQFGAIHKIIELDEFSDENILSNSPDRCYYCKTLLFQTLLQYSSKNGFSYVIDGTNYDDKDVYRPGMKALKELGIHSPLLELQITKKKIRELADFLHIPTSQKPSLPCLATRLPYYTLLDFELLQRLDKGEQYLRQFGFHNVRLRFHKPIVRVEIDIEEIPKLLEIKYSFIQALKQLDFSYITLDLEGFRSGSMDIFLESNITDMEDIN